MKEHDDIDVATSDDSCPLQLKPLTLNVSRITVFPEM